MLDKFIILTSFFNASDFCYKFL